MQYNGQHWLCFFFFLSYTHFRLRCISLSKARGEDWQGREDTGNWAIMHSMLADLSSFSPAGAVCQEKSRSIWVQRLWRHRSLENSSRDLASVCWGPCVSTDRECVIVRIDLWVWRNCMCELTRYRLPPAQTSLPQSCELPAEPFKSGIWRLSCFVSCPQERSPVADTALVSVHQYLKAEKLLWHQIKKYGFVKKNENKQIFSL